jgi:hypothetical protein
MLIIFPDGRADIVSLIHIKLRMNILSDRQEPNLRRTQATNINMVNSLPSDNDVI